MKKYQKDLPTRISVALKNLMKMKIKNLMKIKIKNSIFISSHLHSNVGHIFVKAIIIQNFKYFSKQIEKYSTHVLYLLRYTFIIVFKFIFNFKLNSIIINEQ